MRRTIVWSAAAAALSLAAAGGVGSEPAKADPIPIGIDCDRACLQGMVDQVLAAMVAHDAHRLPLSADFRYTENGQELATNDGFWGTATAEGAYKHYFLDPRTEQAAFFGTMKENGTNTDIIGMRIKMEGHKISEIEAVFSRTGLGSAGPNGAATLEAMGRPDPVWLNDNPDHASREDIIRTSNKYFTALENDDGKGDYSFFADDCWRFENGMQTTSGPHPAPPRPPPAAAPPPPEAPLPRPAQARAPCR